jgi:hypothetical protein
LAPPPAEARAAEAKDKQVGDRAHVGLGIGEPWLLASVYAPQISQN